MRKIIYLAVSVLLSFSSCNDFLDKQPLDSVTEDAVFNDDALLTAYVTACYNAYPTGFDEAMMSSTTDESYTRHGMNSSIVVSQGEMTSDNIDSFDSGRFANFNYWNTAYEYLRNINTFFLKYEGAQVSEDLKKRLYGEMKFIRAFVYANLAWRFGGVPIITHVYTLEDTDYTIKRNTYDECVDFVLQELNEAIQYLPAKMEGDKKGRACADACKALKARVLLYAASPLTNPSNDKKKWELARDAAKDVLELPGYSLSSDYRTLFLKDNNEVIFRRYYTKAQANRVNLFNSPNGYGGWGGNCPIQNLVDDYEMKATGKKISESGSGYDPANPYEGRDPRFYGTILYNGAMFRGRAVETFVPNGQDSEQGAVGGWNCSKTGYYLYKYHDEEQVLNESEATTAPWTFFRLGEFYLNYAEAQYYLGNEEECRKAINVIRSRKGVEMPQVTASGSQLLEKLRNERRVELSFENHRYFDLRRWKVAEEYENKNAMGIKIEKDGNGKLTYQEITILERHFYPQHYWLPIPRSEIIKSNYTLEQNPIYN